MTVKDRFKVRICPRCQESRIENDFSKTKNVFYPDGFCPICNTCLENIIREADYNWEVVDQLCQYLDIPFIPKEWEKIRQKNKLSPFSVYIQLFEDEKHEKLHWAEYFKEFKALEEANLIEEELPLFTEEKIKKLQDIWGANYDAYELNYLEKLYAGILKTQSVNGDLQEDQARKLCKISLEIDGRIRAGEDFDKLLKSYDTLVKIADFTPRNAKNANDFDSVGELFKWLEKRGWKNQYYNGVTKDIVDETLHNIQAYNQRLYTNESGIGDEITERIRALQNVAEYEQKQNDFNTDEVCDDFDNYENTGYNELMKEDFDATVGVSV